MEGIELILFEIITAVGEARSNYIEAINLAREGKFNEAEKLVEEGQLSFVKGHKRHADLVQKTAAGEKIEADILLIHAEDQLMSAEGFQILAEQFIELYKKLL